MLTSLTAEFGNLTNLKIIDISRNYFSELPIELFEVSNLEVLYAGENYVKYINPEISKLKRMRYLNLGNSGEGLRYWAGSTEYDNEISELPVEITQLKNLEFLDLTGNPLLI